jgi:hypothetical protein
MATRESPGTAEGTPEPFKNKTRSKQQQDQHIIQ